MTAKELLLKMAPPGWTVSEALEHLAHVVQRAEPHVDTRLALAMVQRLREGHAKDKAAGVPLLKMEETPGVERVREAPPCDTCGRPEAVHPYELGGHLHTFKKAPRLGEGDQRRDQS